MKSLGSYTLGDQYVSPQRRLSAMLTQQGSRGGPSNSWQETMGRIAQQLAGAYIGRQDSNKQNQAFDAMTGLEPNSYSLQPTMNDQQIMESPAVQKILQKPNDAERMQNPNIQNNIKAIGYEQKHISDLERMNQSINDKLGSFNSPANAQREIDFNNQSITRANQNIDSYGDQFNRNMGNIRGRELTDDQRADRVRDQLIGQRNASMENTLNQKMNPRDYSMQQLRGLENNPYAKRILAQMMMQNADRDYAAGLAKTERGYVDSDYERKRKDEIEDRNYLGENKLAVKKAGEGTGPFGGTGMEAQKFNVLLNGDPSSPVYRAAYNDMAQPKTTFDRDTGQRVSVSPDMSAFRPPTSATGQAPQGQTPQGQAPQSKIPGQPTVSYGEGLGRTKPYNDAQNKASGFYSRMLSANEAMDGVLAGADGVLGTADDVKYDDVNSFGQSALGAVPFFGNDWISNERQQLQQAQENWVSAVLRRESGAVLGDDEIVRENKKYFPQYGDSKETIAQKAKARKKAEDGMLQSSGGAWEAQEKKNANKGRRSGEPNNGGPLSPNEKKRLEELRRKARGQ